jgi:hypothetical protein
LGITKYDTKQDPVQWLRCYALSIENAGGNNDTKCLYFPFCLDQAPLTWLESLEKYSIDKWDQLKEQFTSNFAGAMGRSGTRMDLAMVKQEQDETLRKYMRCFFDKRATVVDVTDEEVIDLFQDGLYHHRTFEDFGRRRLSSITKLKDMITSWADEEDKANAKYDAIRGKSKQNAGGSNNNRDQGGRNNNYSGPNRKRKLDYTVAAIQRPSTGSLEHRTSGSNPSQVVGGTHHLLPRGSMDKLLRTRAVSTRHKAGSRGLQTQQGTHRRWEWAQCSFHQDLEEDEARDHSHAHQEHIAFLRHRPGNAPIPLGSVVLPVTFGETWENYRNKPQPSEEVQVKTIDLGTGDSSKTTTIGAGLDPK